MRPGVYRLRKSRESCSPWSEELARAPDGRVAELQSRVEALEHRLRAAELEIMAQRVYPLIVELLGVLDDLQRALSAAPENANQIREGVQLIEASMANALARHGIEPIVSAYQLFDPNYHEAISREHRPGVAPGYVLREVQRGYVMRGHLLRPARVVVSV